MKSSGCNRGFLITKDHKNVSIVMKLVDMLGLCLVVLKTVQVRVLSIEQQILTYGEAVSQVVLNHRSQVRALVGQRGRRLLYVRKQEKS